MLIIKAEPYVRQHMTGLDDDSLLGFVLSLPAP